MTNGLNICVACITSMHGNEKLGTIMIMKLVSTSASRDLHIKFDRVPIITILMVDHIH